MEHISVQTKAENKEQLSFMGKARLKNSSIKEFSKNIYHLNGLCFGDIKDKPCICYDNCCANQHSFRKYSYSTKSKQYFNNRCINFCPYNCYINQCSFRKNRIKNNVKDFYYERKVNDKSCLLRIDMGSDISIINSNFVDRVNRKL